MRLMQSPHQSQIHKISLHWTGDEMGDVKHPALSNKILKWRSISNNISPGFLSNDEIYEPVAVAQVMVWCHTSENSTHESPMNQCTGLYTCHQGLYSLSSKTSYRKISWSLEAARFGFRLFQSLWNLTGTSAAALPWCLSNFRAIRSL